MSARRLLGPCRLAPILVLGLVTAPASLASTNDVAATHASITAGYALARAAVATIPIAQARIESYDHRLAVECPNVGAGTPETEASQPMSDEVAVALWSISYGAAAGPIERFARAVSPLHWTRALFQGAVHRLATILTALATIRVPDLCADVRAWTASRFTVVPNDVLELDRRVEPLELPEIPWGLVVPYERGGDARLVAYIKRAETMVAEAEFIKGQKDWYQVIETLGLAA